MYPIKDHEEFPVRCLLDWFIGFTEFSKSRALYLCISSQISNKIYQRTLVLSFILNMLSCRVIITLILCVVWLILWFYCCVQKSKSKRFLFAEVHYSKKKKNWWKCFTSSGQTTSYQCFGRIFKFGDIFCIWQQAELIDSIKANELWMCLCFLKVFISLLHRQKGKQILFHPQSCIQLKSYRQTNIYSLFANIANV